MSRMQRIYILRHSLEPSTIPAGTRALTDPQDAFSVALAGRYPAILAFLTTPLEDGRTVKPLDTRRPLKMYLTARTKPTAERLIDLAIDEPKDRYVRAYARGRVCNTR